MTTDYTNTSVGVLLERFATDTCNKNFVVNLSIEVAVTALPLRTGSIAVGPNPAVAATATYSPCTAVVFCSCIPHGQRTSITPK